MTKKYPKFGIIAEDKSDVLSTGILIRRIARNNGIGVKGRSKNGCSILLRKCKDWAINLYESGCSLLVVVHDSDGKDPKVIMKEIRNKLDSCPIVDNLIVIPIQELEAWLLSDPEAIKKALKLKKVPKVKSNTELIDSPKEYLGKAINRASENEKLYINTKHNSMISEIISINIIRKKCPSFVPFYNFIVEKT